jgi:hypothetical protein
VDPTGLFSLTGARPEDAEWMEQFAAMVEYARSRDWVDDVGRIQAHVVWD